MKLIHTSPAQITKLNENGRFGSFLFFSPTEYVMTAGEHFTYELEIDENSLIESSQLFYDENSSLLQSLIAEISDRYNVSESIAESLLDESESIYDVDSNVDAEDLGDESWNIQHFTAQAAKILGYRGVAVKDERGISYMVDMQGRESELKAVA